MRDEFPQGQAPAGCWNDETLGDEHATAMALLVLRFPLDCLSLYLL